MYTYMHSFLRAGGGHFSRDKTLHKICDRFYWRDMTKDKDRVYIHSGKLVERTSQKRLILLL